jgi:Family of unknown function (DUF5995)
MQAIRRLTTTLALASAFAVGAAPGAHGAQGSTCGTTYDAVERAQLLRLSDTAELADLGDALRRVEGVAAMQLARRDRDGIFSVIYRDILRDAVISLDRDRASYTNVPWTTAVSVDFIRRYLNIVHARVAGAPLPAPWARYYRRADDCRYTVGRVAMAGFTTHVFIDFPEAIWSTGAKDADAHDFFFIGDILIDTVPAIVDDLKAYYGYDISGFFRMYWASDLLDPVLGGRGRTSWALFQTARANAWVTGLAMRDPRIRAAVRWGVRSEWLAIDAALDAFQANGAL